MTCCRLWPVLLKSLDVVLVWGDNELGPQGTVPHVVSMTDFTEEVESVDEGRGVLQVISVLFNDLCLNSGETFACSLCLLCCDAWFDLNVAQSLS